MRNRIFAAVAAAVFTHGLVAVMPAAAQVTALRGMASYYKSGKRTANGERFNPLGLTAAHRSLPFGTRVRVTQVKTGRSVVVRINDRGPFVRGRIIDLSLGAAEAIGLNHSGVAKVELVVLERGSGSTAVDAMQAPQASQPKKQATRTLSASLPVTDNIKALARTKEQGLARYGRGAR
jgi:peptidoglycan lytic transglycosylase